MPFETSFVWAPYSIGDERCSRRLFKIYGNILELASSDLDRLESEGLADALDIG